MTLDLESQWRSAERLIRIYSWITLGAVAYGTIAAHVPFVLGTHWSTCVGPGSRLACELMYHLYAVPMALFITYVGWYGLKRYTRRGARSYASLVGFLVMADIVFFTFEVLTVFTVIENGGAEWEIWALSVICMLLLGGGTFGLVVHQKILSLLDHTSNHEVNDVDRSRGHRAELRRKSSSVVE